MTRFNVFFSFVLLFVSSCTLEDAESPQEKELIIASDYLQEKDSTLFKSFSKKHSVRIRILSMDAAQIKQRLSERGVNSGIDLIIIKSMYDVHKIHRKNLIQAIDFSFELADSEQKYSSWKYDYIGFGVDPYVIAYNSQSPNSIKTYNDLTRFDYLNTLSYGDQVTILAPTVHKMQKVNANKWIKKYTKHRIEPKNQSDSLLSNLPTLTTHSSYQRNKDSSALYRNKNILMPNRNSTGTFYNTRTICIVNQAENYVTAKSFSIFYLEKKRNIELNNKLKTLSIYSSSNKFRRYATSTEDLLPYFIMVERVLKKLDVD